MKVLRFLLLGAILMLEQNQICQSSDCPDRKAFCYMNGFQAKKSTQPVLSQGIAISDVDCVQLCCKDRSCLSINYNRTTKICDMFASKSSTNDTVGPYEETTNYYEMSQLNTRMCKTTQLGKEFIGHLSITKTGKTCQHWSSQTPHSHTRTNDLSYPDGSVAAAVNYCRNPDNEKNGPWCYTTDPKVRWQNCNVPCC